MTTEMCVKVEERGRERETGERGEREERGNSFAEKRRLNLQLSFVKLSVEERERGMLSN